MEREVDEVRQFLPLLFVVLWALHGLTQYGPGEWGQGARLEFSARLEGAGTCQEIAGGIRCLVREGSSAVLRLFARRDPPGAVNIRMVSAPPGWPVLPVASGWGTATAEYRFTVPAGSGGQRFELIFEAWTAGVPYPMRITVVLEVAGEVPELPPTEPVYATDEEGRFRVPVEEIPDTVVTGILTRCTVQPLPGVRISVRLLPKPGRLGIRSLGDVGSVRITTPYGSATIERFKLLSSMDERGRVYRTIDVGVVCLLPGGPSKPQALPSEPISVTTDEKGNFSVPLDGGTVSGRLVGCDGKPLSRQRFSLAPVPKDGEIKAVRLEVPGYKPIEVSQFIKLSFFGSTFYQLGEVALPCPEPRLILLDVGIRRGSPTGLTAAEEENPVYFQQQTVDELLRFRVEAVPGSVVLELVAKLHPLAVSRTYAVGPSYYVDLPMEWIPGIEERKRAGLIEIEGWSWALPVPVKEFGVFDTLEVPRFDRVRETPINQDTWFRVQEKRLDEIRIRGGEAALGWWELEAEIKTPDGRIHRVRSVSGKKTELHFRYSDGRVTTAEVSFPQLYLIFSHDVPVYELASAGTLRIKAIPRKAIEISSYYASASANSASENGVELGAEIDLTGISGEWTATMGGAYVMLGDPFSPGGIIDAALATPVIYVCPMVGDDDLPVEGRAEVRIVPPTSSYGLEVVQDYHIGWAIGQELAKELVGLILGEVFPGGAVQRVMKKVIPERLRRPEKLFEWLADEAEETARDELVGLLEEAKKEKKIAAYSAAYQGIFSVDGAASPFMVESRIAGGDQKLSGTFKKAFEVELQSRSRPRYQLISGASLSVFLLGPYDEILYHRVSARASLSPASPWWEIVDGNDRRGYDPDPNSTWK